MQHPTEHQAAIEYIRHLRRMAQGQLSIAQANLPIEPDKITYVLTKLNELSNEIRLAYEDLFKAYSLHEQQVEEKVQQAGDKEIMEYPIIQNN